MERTLTQEERIRRAEEIYLKRKNERPQYSTIRKMEKTQRTQTIKNVTLFKKMALQITVCLLLYCIFYLIYNTNYSFSDVTISKTQDILNYDINIEEMYKYLNEQIMGLIDSNENEEIETENDEKETEDNAESTEEIREEEENTVESSIASPQNEETKEENMEEIEETLETSAEEVDVKQLYSLIVPVARRIYIL